MDLYDGIVRSLDRGQPFNGAIDQPYRARPRYRKLCDRCRLDMRADGTPPSKCTDCDDIAA